MCLCSKQSSLFSFYALPSGGKSKGVVVHSRCLLQHLCVGTPFSFNTALNQIFLCVGQSYCFGYSCGGHFLLRLDSLLKMIPIQDYASRLSSRPGYFGSSNLARSSSTPIVIRRHEGSAEFETEGSAPRTSRLSMLKKELEEARHVLFV